MSDIFDPKTFIDPDAQPTTGKPGLPSDFVDPDAPKPVSNNPVVNLGKGLYKGAVYGLPEQLAKASQFLGIGGETAKKVADWGKAGLGTEEKGSFEQAGEMIPESIGVPIASHVIGSALQAIPHPAAQIAGLTLKIGGKYITPALFGLAQAQTTKETAEKQGVDPGAAPYVTGGIEWAGETAANIALGRLFGNIAAIGKAGKEAIAKMGAAGALKGSIGSYLKTLALQTAPTEILTEMGQNYGEALTEKLYGVRPDADPTGEALSAIAPTAIMTAILGPFGRIARNHVANKQAEFLSQPVNMEDPNAGELKQIRLKMAEGVAGVIPEDNQELRDQWRKYAAQKIERNLPIDITTSLDALSMEIDTQMDDMQDERKVVDSAPTPITEQPVEQQPSPDNTLRDNVRNSALGVMDYIKGRDFTNMVNHPQFGDYYTQVQDLFTEARKTGALTEAEARPLAEWLLKHSPDKEHVDADIGKIAEAYPVGAKVQDANGNIGTVQGHKRVLSDTSPVKVQVAWDNAKPGKLPGTVSPDKISLVQAEAPAITEPIPEEQPTPEVIPDEQPLPEVIPDEQPTPEPIPEGEPVPETVPEEETPPEVPPVKPTHQMTRDEYIQSQVDALNDEEKKAISSNKDLADYFENLWSKEHSEEVKTAQERGENIPQEVMDSILPETPTTETGTESPETEIVPPGAFSQAEPETPASPATPGKRSWYDFKDLPFDQMTDEEVERMLDETGPTAEETAEWEARQQGIADRQGKRQEQEATAEKNKQEIVRRATEARRREYPDIPLRRVAAMIGEMGGANNRTLTCTEFSDELAAKLGIANQYGYLSKIADKMGIRVFLTSAPSVSPTVMTDGMYEPEKKLVTISYRAMSQAMDYGTGYGVAHAWEGFVHEALHGVVRESPQWESSKKRLLAFRATLTPHVKSAPDPIVALINHIDAHEIDELISEAFSNPMFAQWLDSIPAEGVKNPSKTLWGKLKDIIFRVMETFGLPKSKLDELNEILNSVLYVNGVVEDEKPKPPPIPEGTTASWDIVTDSNGQSYIDNPVAEKGRNNWGAVVTADKTAKGGLSRKWLPKVSGGIYGARLDVAEAKTGDYLEFAGDKGKDQRRNYYQVTGVTDGKIHLRQIDKTDITGVEEEIPTHKDYGPLNDIDTVKLSELFVEKIKTYNGKIDKTTVKAWIMNEYGLTSSELNDLEQRGLYDHKAIEEAFEYALAKSARAIINNPDFTEQGKSDRIRSLYDNQPNLAARTSESTIMQQYSTPLPIAWLMNRYLGLVAGNKRSVYEPAAGNGMLLIGANPIYTTANELDKGNRNKNLRDFIEEAGGEVFNGDALNIGTSDIGKFSRVIMNPPFGEGKPNFEAAGYLLSKLEHQIVAQALSVMADDGKAAFIIGGHRDFDTATQSDKVFFNYLYNNYNVTNVIGILGDLYSRQGTKFPVRLITIEGRKATPGTGIPEYINMRGTVGTFEELRDILEREVTNENTSRTETEDQGTEGAEGGRTPTGDNDQNEGRAGGNEPGEPGGGRDTIPDEPGITPEPGGGSTPERGGKRKPDSGGKRGKNEPGGGKDKPVGGGDGEQHARPEPDVSGNASEGTSTGVKTESDQAMGELRDIAASLPDDMFSKAFQKRLFMAFENAEVEQKYQTVVKPAIEKVCEKVIKESGNETNQQEAAVKIKNGLGDFYNKIKKAVVRYLREEFEKLKAMIKEGLLFQEPYKPRSKHPLGTSTLIPKNQATVIQEALDKIEKEHGDIDDYVMGKLKYKNQADMFEAFSPEQIDALAMAIYNMDANAGMIIGDQTGVGKGRIAAGMIRYANMEGKIPIFVTAKANLFTDMYRDMRAIGHAVKPFMMNSHTSDNPANIVDHVTGELLHRADFKGKNIDRLMDNPEKYLKDNDFKVLFTTYSQHQNAANTRKDIALLTLAQDNIVILDESHEAAGASTIDPRKGPSNRNIRFMSVISAAKSVMYSSATYAKTPYNMVLYRRTVIGDSGMSTTDLLNSVIRGGVPMQEYLSNLLVKMGQYVRRELDFSGISYQRTLTMDKAKDGSPEKEALKIEFEEHKRIADKTNEKVNDIIRFDHTLKRDRRNLQALMELLRVKGGQMGIPPDRFSTSITSFTSVLHNIEGQLLSAIKVEKTLKEAKRAIDQNKKVVITFENTMESFLKDLVEREKLKTGDPINFTFKAVMKRALANCLRFKCKNAQGQDTYIRITPEELRTYIPGAAAAYDQAERAIEQYDVPLHASPIDYLRSELKKYSEKPVYELTGRSQMIDYEGTGGVKRLADRKDPDKNNIIRAFNSGKIDVLIVNESGSTGLSLHSSKDFSDTRERVMIIHQADRDINIFMQILGRVNRKGQVTLPSYLDIITSLPSELRPAVVRERKLASLKANTTSSQEGAERSKETPDMMNGYGNHVTREYLAQNKQLAITLGIIRDQNQEIPPDDSSSYAKVSGKIAVLPVDVQKEFFDDIESMYNALMDEVNARGENRLISKDYDFQAKTVDKQLLYNGPDPSNPFTSDVHIERMQVRMIKKPHNTSKIASLIAETLGIDTKNKSYEQLSEEIKDKRAEFKAQLLRNIEKSAQEYLVEWVRKLPERYDNPNTITRETLRKQTAMQREINMVRAAVNQFEIGSTYTFPESQDSGAEELTGVLTNILWGKGAGNPIQPSNIKFVFSLNDPRQTAVHHVGQQWHRFHSRKIEDFIPHDWDDFLPSDRYEPAHRYIVTGNMLRAFTVIPSNTSVEMISFTRDNGNREFGLLVARKDEDSVWGHRPDNNMMDVRWQRAFEYIANDQEAMERFVSTTNGLVSINSRPVMYDTKTKKYIMEYTVNVPSRTDTGGRFFQDRELLALVRNNNFRKQSNRMIGIVEAANIGEFLRILDEKHGITFRIPNPDRPAHMPYELGEVKIDEPPHWISSEDMPWLLREQASFGGVEPTGENKETPWFMKDNVATKSYTKPAYMPFINKKVQAHIDNYTDILLKRPQAIPKEDLQAGKTYLRTQENMKVFDRYFGLPWWNAQKYPFWKKAFEIFGIKRPERRGELMHQFASIAEPFLKLDVIMKKEGRTPQQIQEAKTRINRILIAGDALLGKELRQLRVDLKKEQDEGRKAMMQARITQIETLNRYSDEELTAGIKDEYGNIVKLTQQEITVYKSVRDALDNMFDTYTDHLKAQAFRTYEKQKWYAILCQAAGVDLNRDVTAKIVGQGLKKSALLYAQRIQVDIQAIFKRIEQGITETPEAEKKSAGELYDALATKLSKELLRLQTHLKECLNLSDDAEAVNVTRSVLAAYVKTRPELKQVRTLRNTYKKQVAFFPRVREQGNHKLKLIEHMFDKDGKPLRDRQVHMEMFNNEVEYKNIRTKIMSKYAKNGRLPDNYEIIPEPVTRTPEFAFQGVSDINIQKILDDAIDNMKIEDKGAYEKLRKAGYRAIASQFQSRGWGAHLKHRQWSVTKGYEENDLQRVLFNYMAGMSGIMTKQEAATAFLGIMKDVKNPSMFESLAKYGKDQLRNQIPLDKFSQKARSFMFTWYLGGLLRPAVVQFTQNFVTAIPEYAKFLRKNNIGGAGKADKDYVKAMKDLAVGNTAGIEKELLKDLFTDGITQDQYIREIFGSIGDTFDRSKLKVLRWLATPFSYMEQFNRQSAALTMFRETYKLALKEKGIAYNKDAADEECYQKAFEQARDFVYNTHYAMGKANMPQIAQGGDATSIGIKTLYTFRSFTHNFVLWQKNLLSDGDWKTMMHSLAYMAMFGGLIGLPFLKDLFEWIEKQFGYSPTKAVRTTLRGIGGETLETFGMNGLPGVLGMNISGSLAIGIPGLGETPSDSVYGVWGGLATKLGRAGEAAGRHDWYRVSANMAPEMLRNPIVAMEESEFGKSAGMPGFATTTRGRAIYDEKGKPLQMGPGEAAFKVFGFTPTGNAREKEMNQTIKRQEDWAQEKKRDAAETYRVEKINKDPKAMVHLMAAVKEINQDIRDRGLQKIVPLASVSTVIKSSRELMNKKQQKEMRYKQTEL